MRIVFSGHAIRQMFQRGLKKDDVLSVIQEWQVIHEYLDDTPYPSYLILGHSRDIPIHVVIAMDEPQKIGVVVTAYIPNTRLWNNDFKTRRSK